MVGGNHRYTYKYEKKREKSHHAIMLISPFLSVGHAESMMKIDHHAYKISVVNKNERGCLGFVYQFLSWYLACGEDIGTPHGHTLHWNEQELGIHMEQVVHMGPRHHNSHGIRYLEETIENQTQSIIGQYQETIDNYLTVHECYSQRKPTSMNKNHHPIWRNKARRSENK